MLPADKGTRNLLPPSDHDPDDFFDDDDPFDGQAGAFETSPENLRAIEPNPQDVQGQAAPVNFGEVGPMPISTAAAPHASHALAEPHDLDVHGFPVLSGSWPQSFNLPNSMPVALRGKIKDYERHDDNADRHDPGHDQQHSRPLDPYGRPIDSHDQKVGPATGATPLPAANEVDETAPNHIAVTQSATVDQDASIFIHGYGGSVVARLHIDQDLTMNQDVDIDLSMDGDGRFNLWLNQSTIIDQDVDIDLRIFDVGDVLYVDLFLRDSIEIDQDFALDMGLHHGNYGGGVHVNQSVDMDQDVNIDIDLEDDLAQRYIVKVDVDVVQDTDVDQTAMIDVAGHDGDIETDLDARQLATIDQETIVRIDFALA